MRHAAIHPQNSGVRRTLCGLFAAVAMVAAGAVLAAAPAAQTAEAALVAPDRDGEAMLEAVNANDAATVRKLLGRGVDPDYKSGEALLNAALRGNMDIARILLEKGANANIRGGKALSLAALRGHEAMVDMLLDNPWSKADPKGGDYWAMGNAARNGFAGIVRKLVKAGADVNGRDGFALANAILGAQAETFNVLLDDLKADPNAGNGLALQMAIEGGHMEFVTKLLTLGAISDMPAVENAISAIENGRKSGGDEAQNFTRPVYDDIIAMVRKHQAAAKPKPQAARMAPNPV